MGRTSTVADISRFNAGRDPRRLKHKFAAMRENPFAFLRGSCHLFYRKLPQRELLTKAPKAWICGDLHFDNFGSFKGDNRLTYFDMNDFEEACLAPCTWDLLRFVSSVLVGSFSLRIDEAGRVALCRAFLDAYRKSLVDGAPRWIERSLAKGMVKSLLQEVEGRKRREFLNKRTKYKRGRRRVWIDDEKALETAEEEKWAVTQALGRFARTQDEPGFYRVLDVADRIAGLGSLGVKRYVVLVEGHGSPNKNYLLDVKEARPSALSTYLTVRQPIWRDHAERVVTLQRLTQAASPALLRAITVGENSFVLKELQPSEDRINLESSYGKVPRLEGVIQSMGQVAAWGHLRASGRRGAAAREELQDFGRNDRWVREIVNLGLGLRSQVMKQWQEFAAAYDDESLR